MTFNLVDLRIIDTKKEQSEKGEKSNPQNIKLCDKQKGSSVDRFEFLHLF